MDTLLGLVGGAALGFLGGLYTFYFDTRRSTRDARMTAYRSLWSKSALLPMSPRNHELTYRELRQLWGDLKDWYFHEGGLYLTRPARNQYFTVQRSLAVLFEEPIADACDKKSKQPAKTTAGQWELAYQELDDPVADGDYDTIRCALSELRTQLADDLSSRSRSPVKSLLSKVGIRR
jgi:hypothetical protein